MALMSAVGIFGTYLVYLFASTALIYPAVGTAVGLGLIFSGLLSLVTKKREKIREVASASKSQKMINFAKREEK